jgi:hypothetical protein
VIKIGQIDTKHQYGLKRKEFRQYSAAESSLHLGKLQQSQIQNSSISKPLQESAHAQVSFKGFNISAAKNAFRPVIKIIPEKHANKVITTLESISKKQAVYYQEIRNNYVKYIKENKEFQKANGITQEMIQEFDRGSLPSLPKKPVLLKFANQVASPFKALYRWGEKLVLPKDSPKLAERAKREKILKDFSAYEGLLKAHLIWEKDYRIATGLPKLHPNNDFIIPDEVLIGKINRRRNKVVDPNKGKYSSNSLMIGNRFISGVVYSYFLGTDAYNTTMRYSDDKHEAAAQRKSRIAQEFSRIGLNMYIQNLLVGTFETAVNKSLATAMFVSGSTVAFSEILGRKLVGKPIMPSDKETLDRLEQEMYQKKGILPSIGRLMTNVKKKDTAPVAPQAGDIEKITYKKTKPNEKTFSAFSGNSPNKDKDASTPSFKGYFKVDKMFERQKLKQIIHVLEKADEQTAQRTKETILSAFKKSEYFKTNKPALPKSFEELINNQSLEQIPVGSKDTVWGKVTKSVLVPVNFVKTIAKSTSKGTKKLFNMITGNKTNPLKEELDALKKSNSAEDKEKLKQFNDFLAKRLKEKAWTMSKVQDKDVRIYKEFISLSKKEKEEIEGAKNILLWLEKQLLKEKITIQPDGTLAQQDIAKVEKIFKESVMRADGAKQLEYDGNTFAQANINLSRAITTLFLVTDAYNLTMQYSNDNKKDANKSAKNRAAQEISRISVSAYIMAFVHNLLSKLCNSSLGGAFTLTALTSSINDSLSRKVVGVPLTAKTQEQLEAIDAKNSESKSPIKKALAYSIGKKGLMPAATATTGSNQASNDEIDYFNNDFFITPEIN